MDFHALLKQKPVVIFDGAMGTELAKRGLEMSGTNNLAHPDQVLQVHRDYARAGADILITNTLTMNRLNLESHGLSVDVREVNLAGARLALAAARDGRLVFGDISSTGQLLEPYGDYSEAQFFETFREQASILAEGGVQGFIIETIMDVREAVCALKACKAAADLPVVVCLSFASAEDGGRTVMGDTAAGIARALAENGADAIGANCGSLDPRETAGIVSLYKEAASLPILVQPNAGKPRLADGRTVFDMQPGAFAEGLLLCIEKGACMAGGCCGTTPEHIREIAQRSSHAS